MGSIDEPVARERPIDPRSNDLRDFTSALNEVVKKLDRVYEQSRRHAYMLFFLLGLMIGWLCHPQLLNSPMSGSPTNPAPTSFHWFRFRLEPEAYVIGAILIFVVGVLLPAAWAILRGLRDRPSVRIKIGDQVVDYDPKVSDEEFERQIVGAFKK
jgi:hypothetical protein